MSEEQVYDYHIRAKRYYLKCRECPNELYVTDYNEQGGATDFHCSIHGDVHDTQVLAVWEEAYIKCDHIGEEIGPFDIVATYSEGMKVKDMTFYPD